MADTMSLMARSGADKLKCDYQRSFSIYAEVNFLLLRALSFQFGHPSAPKTPQTMLTIGVSNEPRVLTTSGYGWRPTKLEWPLPQK